MMNVLICCLLGSITLPHCFASAASIVEFDLLWDHVYFIMWDQRQYRKWSSVSTPLSCNTELCNIQKTVDMFNIRNYSIVRGWEASKTLHQNNMIDAGFYQNTAAKDVYLAAAHYMALDLAAEHIYDHVLIIESNFVLAHNFLSQIASVRQRLDVSYESHTMQHVKHYKRWLIRWNTHCSSNQLLYSNKGCTYYGGPNQDKMTYKSLEDMGRVALLGMDPLVRSLKRLESFGSVCYETDSASASVLLAANTPLQLRSELFSTALPIDKNFEELVFSASTLVWTYKPDSSNSKRGGERKGSYTSNTHRYNTSIISRMSSNDVSGWTHVYILIHEELDHSGRLRKIYSALDNLQLRDTIPSRVRYTILHDNHRFCRTYTDGTVNVEKDDVHAYYKLHQCAYAHITSFPTIGAIRDRYLIIDEPMLTTWINNNDEMLGGRVGDDGNKVVPRLLLYSFHNTSHDVIDVVRRAAVCYTNDKVVRERDHIEHSTREQFLTFLTLMRNLLSEQCGDNVECSYVYEVTQKGAYSLLHWETDRQIFVLCRHAIHISHPRESPEVLAHAQQPSQSGNSHPSDDIPTAASSIPITGIVVAVNEFSYKKLPNYFKSETGNVMAYRAWCIFQGLQHVINNPNPNPPFGDGRMNEYPPMRNQSRLNSDKIKLSYGAFGRSHVKHAAHLKELSLTHSHIIMFEYGVHMIKHWCDPVIRDALNHFKVKVMHTIEGTESMLGHWDLVNKLSLSDVCGSSRENARFTYVASQMNFVFSGVFGRTTTIKSRIHPNVTVAYLPVASWRNVSEVQKHAPHNNLTSYNHNLQPIPSILLRQSKASFQGGDMIIVFIDFDPRHIGQRRVLHLLVSGLLRYKETYANQQKGGKEVNVNASSFVPIEIHMQYREEFSAIVTVPPAAIKDEDSSSKSTTAKNEALSPALLALLRSAVDYWLPYPIGPFQYMEYFSSIDVYATCIRSSYENPVAESALQGAMLLTMPGLVLSEHHVHSHTSMLVDSIDDVVYQLQHWFPKVAVTLPSTANGSWTGVEGKGSSYHPWLDTREIVSQFAWSKHNPIWCAQRMLNILNSSNQ